MANTASAAPIAVATSVVSAAAPSTTQYAVARRVDRVPRGWITTARIPAETGNGNPHAHNDFTCSLAGSDTPGVAAAAGGSRSANR